MNLLNLLQKKNANTDTTNKKSPKKHSQNNAVKITATTMHTETKQKHFTTPLDNKTI